MGFPRAPTHLFATGVPPVGNFPGSAGFQARMPKDGRIDCAQRQQATGVPPVRVLVTASISKSPSGSKEEGKPMALKHERLDVYRLAIRDVAWVHEKGAYRE